MKLLTLGLALSLASHTALAATPAAPLQDKQAFIDHLLGEMNQAEKIGQLRLISVSPEMTFDHIQEEIAAGRIGGTFNSRTAPQNRPMQDAALRSRLKIPMFFAFDTIHGQRTIFPISLGLAATWDLDAVAKVGRISAEEASADSLDMTFAPMVDIARDPRWGRTSEGFGEDTYLTSQMGATMVKALQGDGADKAGNVMAIVKHFALYGAVEGGRDYNTVDMSLPKMYNDYLPPYRAGLDAGAGGVMVALNSINGVPATSNTWLMNDLLRGRWGFKGVAISDHGAIQELVRHGVARDGREAAKLAIKAGIDMSMNDFLYGQELPGLLASGEVTEAELNNAVREVLGAKYDMGLFANPYLRIGKAEADLPDYYGEDRLHRDVARDVARRSLVLLENRERTLPLKKGATVAVVGPLADSQADILGSWAADGHPEHAVTVREGLRRALDGKGKVLYAKGSNLTEDQAILDYLNFFNTKETSVVKDPRPPAAMRDEAVKAAQQADVIVAVVGESRGMSHESSSRTSLEIPATQRELIKALKATGKPLVLVLMNGRPLSIAWEREQADAVLETWFSGTEGGNAIADVLFGDYNPSGKLAITFPRSVGQIPLYYNHLSIGRTRPDDGNPGNYTSQYFDEPNGPLYPFGYGLSYTTFSLADLTLSRTAVKRGDTVQAEVLVKNTGDREGETVVQLYVRDVTASMSQPVKSLRHFQKVLLRAGEARKVKFELSEAELQFYNGALQQVAEPGQFEVQVGLDSQTVERKSFELL